MTTAFIIHLVVDDYAAREERCEPSRPEFLFSEFLVLFPAWLRVAFMAKVAHLNLTWSPSGSWART